MGSEGTPTATAQRRLKFSSVRRLEGPALRAKTADDDALAEVGAFAPIGEALTTAYVAVARRLLLGLETVQDERAQRRAAALRSDTHAGAITRSRGAASS
jgi:hypothetical protein